MRLGADMGGFQPSSQRWAVTVSDRRACSTDLGGGQLGESKALADPMPDPSNIEEGVYAD
jgi:hypothetical protein